MKKKIMTMLMLLAVSCMIMPTNAKAAKKAYIKTSTGSKATVFVGKTLKLNAKTVGKKKKITYKTSKKSVATVNKKGVIKGKKYGTAKITMKASGVKTKKITVYVRKAATGIKLSSAQTINFYKTGNTAQIKATALPGGKQMASKTLTYKSSNPQVAVVNSKGKVTAKKADTAEFRFLPLQDQERSAQKMLMFLYMMDLMMYAVKHLEARQHLHLIQTGDLSQFILQVKQENNILIKWIVSKQNLICWRMSKDLQTNAME